nr:hypothetical protein GCM10020241_55090 [Streptoalloteichus tenebrarius]
MLTGGAPGGDGPGLLSGHGEPLPQCGDESGGHLRQALQADGLRRVPQADGLRRVPQADGLRCVPQVVSEAVPQAGVGTSAGVRG